MSSHVENGTMITGINNRSGISTALDAARATLEGAQASEPSSHDERVAEEMRSAYGAEQIRVGSGPPSLQAQLLDKMGERLAFERTGTRLYEGLMRKRLVAKDDFPPTVADLEKLHAEELEHFTMLSKSIVLLGGDPTLETPSADVAGVASSGICKVIADPRTTLTQCLDAILVAELVDNDAWASLITLAKKRGHVPIAEAFTKALAEEAQHLAMVRAWLETRVENGIE